MLQKFTQNSVFVILLYATTALIILFSLFLSVHFNIPYADLTRDPISVANAKPYFGLISNLGVIFWSFSGAICLITSLSIKSRIKSDGNINFILLGGIISLVLLVDDLFLFHEKVFPKLFNLNEKVLFAGYALLILFYLIKYREQIKKTNYSILLISLTFFAISVLVDMLPEFSEEWHHFYEDTPKFIGIMSWFCYQYLVCKNMLTDCMKIE